MSDKNTADCGARFEHDAHLYRTERDKIKACDGVIRSEKESKS